MHPKATGNNVICTSSRKLNCCWFFISRVLPTLASFSEQESIEYRLRVDLKSPRPLGRPDVQPSGCSMAVTCRPYALANERRHDRGITKKLAILANLILPSLNREVRCDLARGRGPDLPPEIPRNIPKMSLSAFSGYPLSSHGRPKARSPRGEITQNLAILNRGRH